MVSASTLKRARKTIFGGESLVPHMYLDSVGKVTIGYGTMLANGKAAEKIALASKEKKAASITEKSAEWERVAALAPKKGKQNNKASAFAADAVLFVGEEEASRLADQHIADLVPALKSTFPDFEKFPEEAQVALFDMGYNLGATGLRKFKNLIAAINNPKGPDWATAAHESARPQLSKERNKEVRELFLAAAKQVKKVPADKKSPADPHLVLP
jgi:GH24 family phage-related lysozyme (muramidase)